METRESYKRCREDKSGKEESHFMQQLDAPHVPFSTRQLSKLALGVGLGSVVEYYDFFIALFASAIIWPSVFFSWARTPSLAYGLSLASFGVLYFTRPIGAYIFGHYGDKIGRRSLVLWTLAIMGVGVAGVGLDPSYASIGVSSVVFLFVFRGLFGLGLGGEFGGAASWLVEASRKSKWRSFWAVWSAPSQVGYALASLSFAVVGLIYGKGLFSIGWRIPFLVGSVLVIIGLVVRYTLEESPLFQTLKDRNQLERRPANYALTHHWKQILLLSGVLMLVLLPSGVLQASYGIAYLSALGVSSSFITFSIGVAASIGAFFLIIGPVASEHFGRKRILLATAFVTIISIMIYFPMLQTLNPTIMVLAQILLQTTSAASLAISAAVFAEYFPTAIRYSASGMSFQIGGLYYGIIATFILPVIFSHLGILQSAPFVIVTILVAMVVSLFCLIFMRETRGESMSL